MKNTVITIIGGVIGGLLFSIIIFSTIYFLSITEIESLGLFIIILYILSPLFIIGGAIAGVFFIENTSEILGYGVAGGILATMLVIIILIDRTDMPTGALSILYYFSYPTLIIIGGTMAGVIYGQKYKNK